MKTLNEREKKSRLKFVRGNIRLWNVYDTHFFQHKVNQFLTLALWVSLIFAENKNKCIYIFLKDHHHLSGRDVFFTMITCTYLHWYHLFWCCCSYSHRMFGCFVFQLAFSSIDNNIGFLFVYHQLWLKLDVSSHAVRFYTSVNKQSAQFIVSTHRSIHYMNAKFECPDFVKHRHF